MHTSVGSRLDRWPRTILICCPEQEWPDVACSAPSRLSLPTNSIRLASFVDIMIFPGGVAWPLVCHTGIRGCGLVAARPRSSATDVPSISCLRPHVRLQGHESGGLTACGSDLDAQTWQRPRPSLPLQACCCILQGVVPGLAEGAAGDETGPRSVPRDISAPGYPASGF